MASCKRGGSLVRLPRLGLVTRSLGLLYQPQLQQLLLRINEQLQPKYENFPAPCRVRAEMSS